MRPEFEDIAVVKNTDLNRFEMAIDGYVAFIDYKEKDQIIALTHTESPVELAGRGVATALIEKTLLYLEENEYTLLPLCPLVFAYIKKNLRWLLIVREDFRAKFD